VSALSIATIFRSASAARGNPDLFGRSVELVECVSSAIRLGTPEALAPIRESGDKFQTYCDEISVYHQERVIRGVCTPRASSIFLSMLDSFREIERYVRRITLQLAKASPRRKSARRNRSTDYADSHRFAHALCREDTKTAPSISRRTVPRLFGSDHQGRP